MMSELCRKSIYRFPDFETACREAAASIHQQADRCIDTDGRFTLVLSGGESPRRLYEILAAPPHGDGIRWEVVHLFWGDERCVPPDHRESNFRLARERLIDHIAIPPENVHRMQGELDDPEAAAEHYEQVIREVIGDRSLLFDLVLLGLGGDGHTASLFPGSTALPEKDHLVMAVTAPPDTPVRNRLTLTLQAINASDRALFLAAGPKKRGIVSDILDVTTDARRYPAAWVTPRSEIAWYLSDRK